MIRKLLKLSLWILIGVIANFIYRFSFSCPNLVETVYSRGIYPLFTKLFVKIQSVFSFSLAEVLLYVLAAFLVFFVIFIFVGFFKPSPRRFYTGIKRIISLLIIAASLYAGFVFLWGINYARNPLSKSMGVTVSESSKQELASLCRSLAKTTSALRAQVAEDENGVFCLSSSKEEIFSQVKDLYADYAPDYLNLSAPANVKTTLIKNLLSHTTTTGIYSPFTFECQVNGDMPALFLPVTALHEYSHYNGFAREDEANFIAYYIARNAENTDFAYSANALALTYAMNSLYEEDASLHAEIYRSLNPGIIRDWKYDNQYWKPYRTTFAESANEVYDTYLQSNGVAEGRKSYGRMLDLLLALSRTNDPYLSTKK